MHYIITYKENPYTGTCNICACCVCACVMCACTYLHQNSKFTDLPCCIIGGHDLIPYEVLSTQQTECIQNGLKACNISNVLLNSVEYFKAWLSLYRLRRVSNNLNKYLVHGLDLENLVAGTIWGYNFYHTFLKSRHPALLEKSGWMCQSGSSKAKSSEKIKSPKLQASCGISRDK